MKLKNAYVKVSRRAILSANAMLKANIPEAAVFYAYHAFESIGGALCASVGEDYSMSHDGKINQFVAIAKKKWLHQRVKGVSEVAQSLRHLRNKLLYPQLIGGEITLPSEVLSLREAETLLKRVKGICKKVEDYL